MWTVLAVNAVKYGRLLILEGIEKAERGIMPVRILLDQVTPSLIIIQF